MKKLCLLVAILFLVACGSQSPTPTSDEPAVQTTPVTTPDTSTPDDSTDDETADDQTDTPADKPADKDSDGIADADDNCVDLANATQTDTNDNDIGDDCEMYDIYPVKFLSIDEKTLWNGIYPLDTDAPFGSNDCGWDAPINASILTSDTDNSQAQLSLYYDASSGYSDDHFQGTFTYISDSTYLRFDANEWWKGYAIQTSGNGLNVQFQSKEDSSFDCTQRFIKL